MSNRRLQRPNQQNISKQTLNKLSELRRAEIHSVESKKIEKIEEDSNNQKPTPYVLHSSAYKGIKKHANAGPVTLPTTRGLSDMLGPEVYSPLFQLANLNLPRDRVTMNAWNRIFYDTHPIVRNAINLHASYPISKINISHPVKKIQEFFLEMAERIDLYSVVYGAALEFFKQGECFPYAELDSNTNTWKRITILNPDFIHVKKAAIGDQTIISLKPDAALQKLVNSNSPADIALKRRLPRNIIEAVKRGESIPLDNINISHLKLLSSPYDIRGTSIIVSVYKDLMHYDKLRESKFAQADGMINPLTLVKVGSAEDRATQGDIDAMRGALEEAQYDKDFKLVTHEAVTIERIGFSGAIVDVSPDLELIINNLYTGLMVPKALVDQESSTYASSSIGLEVLRQRYDIFRNMIKKWLEQKIFAPISELQGFFTYKDGQQCLEVPTVDFNHMNLYDMSDYVQGIGSFVANKQVSLQTLYRTLGLSYEEERRRLKEEAIHEVIRSKEIESLNRMRLRELENIDINGVIPESTELPGGGAPPEGSLPGMEEMPGMDIPGLGMPPGPSGGPGSTPPLPEGPGAGGEKSPTP